MARKPRPFDGAGELLLAIRPDERVELGQLMERLGWNRQTLYNRLKVLEELGLIDSSYESRPPGRRIIWLTEKGVRVRELLEQLYRLLEER